MESILLYGSILANKEGMTEHYHFANLNELMDLGIGHQYLLISKRRDKQNMVV
jgi:hypothetical protein